MNECCNANDRVVQFSAKVQDMEEESSSESEDEIQTEILQSAAARRTFVGGVSLPLLPPTPDKVIVKKGYDPKLGKY